MRPHILDSENVAGYTIDTPDIIDIINLHPVLEKWIQWKGEILWDELEKIQRQMRDSVMILNRSKYFVIRDINKKAVGICGLTPPPTNFYKYISEPGKTALMMTNFYIDDSHRGKGLGKLMLEHVRKEAGELGADEIIWHSGERYRDTAYGFYNKIAGEPVAIIKDFYGSESKTGPQYDAPVWRISTIKE